MLTVEQARAVVGVGRSLASGEVRRHLATDGWQVIPAARIGSAIRVPRVGLVDLILAAPAPRRNPFYKGVSRPAEGVGRRSRS